MVSPEPLATTQHFGFGRIDQLDGVVGQSSPGREQQRRVRRDGRSRRLCHGIELIEQGRSLGQFAGVDMCPDT